MTSGISNAWPSPFIGHRAVWLESLQDDDDASEAISAFSSSWPLAIKVTQLALWQPVARAVQGPSTYQLRKGRVMSQSVWFRRQVSVSMTWSLAALAMCVVGCVNLDKRKTTPDFASKAKMTMEDLKKFTTPGSKATSIVSKMRDSIPGFPRPKPEIAGRVISKDDPTSLDKLPKSLGADVYLSTARMAEQQGRPDIAREHYQTILQTTPGNRNALIGLARLHHRAGNTAAAIQIYRDALATHQNDSTILNDLGLCYARSGQLQNAISALEAAVSLAPNHRMYLNNLATALVEGNRTDQALAVLSRVQGADAANLQVGFLLKKAGQNQQAATFLNQALALNPGLDDARKMLEDSAPRVSSLPSQYTGGSPGNGQPVVTPIQPAIGR